MPETPSVLIFADLDDTLFQTRPKCPPDTEIFPMALDRAGLPRSFATQKQRRLFGWLTRDAELVPVTGRNSEGVWRVQLPFERYAITSFGGVILTPGKVPHAAWAEHIERESQAHLEVLRALRQHTLELAAREEVNLRSNILDDHEIPLYLSIKHNEGDVEAVARFTGTLAESDAFPAGWRMHLNGNNLACLPPYLAKEHAVAYFMEHLAEPGALTFGFGDSHSDAPFIALCDYAMAPTGTQLGRHLHTVRAYAHVR